MSPDFQHPQTEWEDESPSRGISFFSALLVGLYFCCMLLWVVLTRWQVVVVLVAILCLVAGMWLTDVPPSQDAQLEHSAAEKWAGLSPLFI